MRLLPISTILALFFAICAADLNVPAILGTYELEHSENFEEYMEALGVGLLMRKLAAHATPTTKVIKNGDNWNFKTSTTFTSSDINFQLGVPFTELTADGRSCLSIITNEANNTLKHVQKNCGGGENGFLITREFTGDKLKMILTAPNGTNGLVVSKRIYKKL